MRRPDLPHRDRRGGGRPRRSAIAPGRLLRWQAAAPAASEGATARRLGEDRARRHRHGLHPAHRHGAGHAHGARDDGGRRARRRLVEASAPNARRPKRPFANRFLARRLDPAGPQCRRSRRRRRHWLRARRRARSICRSPAARPRCASPASSACVSPVPRRAPCWSRPPRDAGKSRATSMTVPTASSATPRPAAGALRRTGGRGCEARRARDPRFNQRQDYKIIGPSPPRLDIPAKVTGAMQYGIDFSCPTCCMPPCGRRRCMAAG